MKLKNKLYTFAASWITTVSTVAAHAGEDEGTNTGMMTWGDGGGWMHTGADMMGYDMWGMGWYGALMGLAFWTLVVLGIIFLYQQVTAREPEQSGAGDTE